MGTQSISSQGGEDKRGVAVKGPVLAKKFQGGMRKGHIAVFFYFSSVDVDHHAFGVNV
jgi:hypothetical protein